MMLLKCILLTYVQHCMAYTALFILRVFFFLPCSRFSFSTLQDKIRTNLEIRCSPICKGRICVAFQAQVLMNSIVGCLKMERRSPLHTLGTLFF